MPASPVTRIDLFTVPPRAVPWAIARMASSRPVLARQPGLRFSKLLGTGDGRTFDVRDADPRRWAVLTVWETADHAVRFARRDGGLQGWRRGATEHWWTTLTTVRAHGAWSGRQPFGGPAAPGAPPGPAPAPAGATATGPVPGAAPTGAVAAGPVAVITRARLRWRRAGAFWRAVPAVTTDLAAHDGVLLRIGIGEAPIGLQGTLSVWRDARAMQAFAYRALPHRTVIRRSREEAWYTEELFARFAIVDHGGTVFGRDPLA